MAKVSAVITTCDEQDYIEDCLKSVNWVDEIVIVDLESTDDTVDICRKYTDKIFTHPRVPFVELVRQFCIDKATGDWILVLDPDERVSPELADTLRGISSSEGIASVYEIPFRTWMFGRQINWGGWGQTKHIRFFRRGAVTWPPEVHARPTPNATVYPLDNSAGYIEHLNYRDIYHFVSKLNRYTNAEAIRLRDNGRPFHWLKLFYQPTKVFYTYYVRNKGYRDGLLGLMLALLMAFYTQVSYMKLWELYDRERREQSG